MRCFALLVVSLLYVKTLKLYLYSLNKTLKKKKVGKVSICKTKLFYELSFVLFCERIILPLWPTIKTTTVFLTSKHNSRARMQFTSAQLRKYPNSYVKINQIKPHSGKKGIVTKLKAILKQRFWKSESLEIQGFYRTFIFLKTYEVAVILPILDKLRAAQMK